MNYAAKESFTPELPCHLLNEAKFKQNIDRKKTINFCSCKNCCYLKNILTLF